MKVKMKKLKARFGPNLKQGMPFVSGIGIQTGDNCAPEVELIDVLPLQVPHGWPGLRLPVQPDVPSPPDPPDRHRQRAW